MRRLESLLLPLVILAAFAACEFIVKTSDLPLPATDGGAGSVDAAIVPGADVGTPIDAGTTASGADAGAAIDAGATVPGADVGASSDVGTISPGADGGATPDGGPTLQALFPTDNEVPGWAIDMSKSPQGVVVYTGTTSADGAVDGDAAPFETVGFTALARVFYGPLADAGGTQNLEVRVWQMNDAAKGTQIYSQILSSPSYDSITFTTVAIGTDGRWGFRNSTTWLVDSHKGVYFVEARLSPSTSSATTDKDQAVEMVTAVVAKIP